MVKYNSVMFRFRDQLPQTRQAELLGEIASWPQVKIAQSFSPTSTRDALRRTCFVELEEGVDLEPVCRDLAEMPDVEEVSTPSTRRLV